MAPFVSIAACCELLFFLMELWSWDGKVLPPIPKIDFALRRPLPNPAILALERLNFQHRSIEERSLPAKSVLTKKTKI